MARRRCSARRVPPVLTKTVKLGRDGGLTRAHFVLIVGQVHEMRTRIIKVPELASGFLPPHCPLPDWFSSLTNSRPA